MCEKCDELRGALTSADQERIHAAILDWINAKAGEDFSVVCRYTDSGYVERNADEFQPEIESVMKHGAMMTSLVLNLSDTNPLMVMLDPAIGGFAIMLMEFVWTAFWYGHGVGTRNKIAEQVLMGEVADDPA